MSVRRKLLLVVSITCIALVAGLYACACLLLRRTDLGSPLTAAVLLVGLAIVLLAVSLVLEAVALARTSRLAESIIAMAAKGDLSARMPVRGSSGLSRLGRAINALLEGLEQAERQRRAAEARAIQSRDFYLTLLDEFPALVWRTGADGSCDYVNKSWLAFCGRPSADILGDGWLASWHPEDRTRFVAAMQAALTERRPLEVEHRLRRADGQYRWFVNIGRPFSNLDGEFAGYLGYCFDITDRKRLEDQLRHVQKMEAVGRLAGGVAHDFNNLLTALTGYLTFVRDTLPSDHAAADDVAQALRATERAAGLTRQLLVFSRRQPADPTVVDLNETIASMEKMLRRLLSERIEVVLALDPALVTVCVDPTHIEQVILNLAVNAGDAMPAGGQLTIETANVTLDAEYARQHVDVAPGEYAMLAVSDTGIGMSDEVKARLFEPFFTTKEPGRGTGLGLATCWAIVRQNGGHIGCYSEQGRGTTFKVYFPRADGAVGPMPLARMEEPVMADRPRTVLLVEDDEAVRVFTARALRQAGYAVLETADGAEALSAARESDGIDLLITDVVMPHIGGEELTARLRARNPELRTLYISGYTANAAAQNGALALAGSFLQKPFTPASLTRKVSEILSDGQS